MGVTYSGYQLQRVTNEVVSKDSPILFDSVVTKFGSGMAYNSTTGEITISSAGVYEINWWVALAESITQAGVGFAISVTDVTGEKIIRGNAPNMAGLVVGNAIINATANTVIKLINVTPPAPRIRLATDTEVKADLTVMGLMGS